MTENTTSCPEKNEEFQPLIAPEDAPRISLQHIDGVYVTRSKHLHRHVLREDKGNSNGNFLIIPVTRGSEGLSNDVLTKDVVGYDNILLSRFVAIGYKQQNGTISFLSCPRHYGTGNRWVWSVNRIHRYEVFEVERCFYQDTFAFKSHNGLYLHYRRSTGTLEFRCVLSDVARWKIHFVNSGREPKRVYYIGILKLSSGEAPSMNIQSIAVETSFDKDHFNDVLRVLQQVISPSQSYIFPDPLLTQHQWFVKTDTDMNIYIMITCTDYPKWIGTQCIDELEGRYKKLTASHSKKNVVQERVAKYLLATRLHYDDLDSLIKTVEVDPEIIALVQKMEENINNILSNIQSAESLKAKSDDLLEQTKIFKRRAKKLRNHQKWLLPTIFAATGAAIGGTTGFLVGGPGAAAVLGTELAEIFAGVGIGLLPSVLYTAGAEGTFFWTNTDKSIQSLGKLRKAMNLRFGKNGKE